MYQVLARKCRPQTFEQLIGQPHVSRTLSNAINGDRLAHAYIFAGVRGTGKTTVARILAKCLNCKDGPTAKPCDDCDACREIRESRAIDVLEVDAASRTKVDQTRELLEVVAYAPVRDRYKVLIIDEAHMLSKSSFNALLKTLEEPPPNVVFVLATTELQKVPATILSRCQVFEFRRVGLAEVAAHLRSICDAERIEVSGAALERLARAGEGSVRDALSLLERALALGGGTIEEHDVLRMLGAVRAQVLTDMIGAFAARDAAAMLGVLDSIVDEGHDLVHFWNAMIAAVRDLLVERTLPGRRELLSRPPDEAAELCRAAEGLSREDLTRAFQILADLEPGLKASSQPRFLWEAALIRLASLGAVRPIEELLGALWESPTGLAAQKKKGADAPVARAPRSDLSAAAAGPVEPRGAGAEAFAPQWVEAVRAARPMVGAMLEQATLSLVRGELLVRFGTGMEALRRQVEASAPLLQEHARRLLGQPVVVRVSSDADTAPAPAERRPTPVAPARAAEPAPAPEVPRAEAGGSDALLDQARAEPGVRKLIEAFGAHVVTIRRDEAPTGRKRAADRVRPPEDSP